MLVKSLLLILVFFLDISIAKAKTKTSEVYAGGIDYFRDFTVNEASNMKFISFRGFHNQVYTMDCDVDKAGRKWSCFIPCDGGRLEFIKGANVVKVSPFHITPRHCDGTESATDRKLKSEKTLVLKRKLPKKK